MRRGGAIYRPPTGATRGAHRAQVLLDLDLSGLGPGLLQGQLDLFGLGHVDGGQPAVVDQSHVGTPLQQLVNDVIVAVDSLQDG